MVVKRRRKSSRQLGSGTYGWGKNKHRNSGSRGGYGNAGSGKKSHGKKPSVWGTDYFGKFGFAKKRNAVVTSTINLRDLDDKLPSWVDGKLASVEGNVFVVDLEKVGYDKLLSAGMLKRKVRISVSRAAKGAAEKVKAAGGELVVKETDE